MQYFLAIDQSTSSTKAILFDAQGSEIAQVSADHRQIYPRPGWVEHDAEEIWQNTCGVIRKLLADHPMIKPTCISIANQRETVVVFDRATGRPVYNAIVWQCRRGTELCQKLKDAGHERDVIASTGLPLDTYFSASKITWLMDNDPVIAAGLKSGKLVIGNIDSYLIHRLTAGKTFATDATNASRTMLYDISRREWDRSLCELFRVPVQALPAVRGSTDNYGTVDVPGLPALPIVGVMGDSQAALFAQRCFTAGATKLTFGTGSSILLTTGRHMVPGPAGICVTLAWVHADEPTYCYEGIINYSAATVTWLKDQLGLINNAAESESIAQQVPDNGGVYLVPAFVGLSAPYWAPKARASITGLSAQSDKRHIVRAALEAIGYQIADVLECMRDSAGARLTRIYADGGPTKNAFLMQFVADVTGVELVVSSVPNCSALGVAMAGMLGSGTHASIEALTKLPREQKIFTPKMPADQVAKLREGWRIAVGRTLMH